LSQVAGAGVFFEFDSGDRDETDDEADYEAGALVSQAWLPAVEKASSKEEETWLPSSFSPKVVVVRASKLDRASCRARPRAKVLGRPSHGSRYAGRQETWPLQQML